MLHMVHDYHNTAFLYYYWQLPDKNVWDNVAHPIICSIATLRCFCKEVPIYVIDVSHNCNWGNFPQDLNFQVFNKRQFLSEVKSPKFEFFNDFSRLVLSKVFDVYDFSKNIKENRIVVSDADVFWVKNPFPFEFNSGFCMDGQNSGFWYFHKDDDLFLKKILRLMMGSIKSSKITGLIYSKSNCGQKIFLEETVFRFACSYIPGCNYISHRENFYLLLYYHFSLSLENVKNIHVIYHCVQGKRLEFIKNIFEIVNALKKTLTDKQLEMVFGTNDINPRWSYLDRSNILDFMMLLQSN